jgi:hypothetical protein
LLFGVRGQGGRELLSGKIHTSDDPAASPQGEDDQRNDEHTGHVVRLAITKISPTHKGISLEKVSRVCNVLHLY